jgi:hypothetical protein
MKKAWKVYALTACLGLSVVSTWLVLSPIPVLAAEGTADCGGFTKVRCATNAVRCVCQDGVGCTSYFADGSTSEAKCKNVGISMEDGPVN